MLEAFDGVSEQQKEHVFKRPKRGERIVSERPNRVLSEEHDKRHRAYGEARALVGKRAIESRRCAPVPSSNALPFAKQGISWSNETGAGRN